MLRRCAVRSSGYAPGTARGARLSDAALQRQRSLRTGRDAPSAAAAAPAASSSGTLESPRAAHVRRSAERYRPFHDDDDPRYWTKLIAGGVFFGSAALHSQGRLAPLFNWVGAVIEAAVYLVMAYADLYASRAYEWLTARAKPVRP